MPELGMCRYGPAGMAVLPAPSAPLDQAGVAIGKEPVPGGHRIRIGGLDPLEAAPLENGEVQAKTAFLVYRSHLDTDHQLLSGCQEDLLRKVNGASKVARRTIVLDANVLLGKNLSVLL
jgi:hypothetical protein